MFSVISFTFAVDFGRNVGVFDNIQRKFFVRFKKHNFLGFAVGYV